MPLSMVTGRFGGRARAVVLTLAPVFAAVVALALTSTPPPPARFVTDGAGFLSAQAHDELEQRLERYQRDTGHQVLLWIGQTTEGEPIESWAVRAFEAWRVGRKGLDDGVAVFILAADRRLRIEVGYGLEDRLPDALTSRIISDQMIPRLRAGDQDGAARAGVSGVLAAVGGERDAPRDAVRAPDALPELSRGQLLVLGLIGLLVLGFVVANPNLALMLLTTIASNSGRGGGSWGGGSNWGGGGHWGGGGFGGGGGGFSGGGGRSGGGGASGSW